MKAMLSLKVHKCVMIYKPAMEPWLNEIFIECEFYLKNI